ncbi:MAG: molybdenum cofactor cytidylyltransferase [Candidatus Cloacimonadota bacterium]|jgi:molybdenum cofactor cytidylyltransferase|nr:molybdenum cofactor cytidylyltransferase [Candidatus Cloacimonadota bacterium]
MLEGIVLAAGYSSRAGGMKLTFRINGKPLLQHTLQPMLQFCNKIWVVTGYKKELIEALISKYPQVEAVYNADFQQGMFSSVCVGVSKITSARFFFTPGDIPFVKPLTYQKLLEKYGKVVIPTYQNRKGHPILMNSELQKRILAEPQDSNLRKVLHKFQPVLVEVDDKAILKDIDTLEDYKELHADFSRDSK